MPEMRKESRDRFLRELNERRIPFERYEFVQDEMGMKELGGGSFGIVYEGRGREWLAGNDCAIKVLGFRETVYPDQIGQIEKEIRLQNELYGSCPGGVVRIEDAKFLYVRFGEEGELLEVAGDRPEEKGEEYQIFVFVVMEKLRPLLGGARSGRPYLTNEALAACEESELLKFALEIGDVLRTAHEHKPPILHRDIKLENIFYSEVYQVYKLGDFGIARAAEGGNASTRGAGTWGNIAPEAEDWGIGGSGYDQRADIYSFGIMLYLLLNDLNYPGSDEYRCERHVQYNQDAQPLPEPAHGSEELRRIALKACSYWPEDRYQSAAELLKDLRAAQEWATFPQEPAAPAWPEEEEGIVVSRYGEPEPTEEAEEFPASVQSEEASGERGERQDGSPRAFPFDTARMEPIWSWIPAGFLLCVIGSGMSFSIDRFTPNLQIALGVALGYTGMSLIVEAVASWTFRLLFNAARFCVVVCGPACMLLLGWLSIWYQWTMIRGSVLEYSGIVSFLLVGLVNLVFRPGRKAKKG